MIFIQFIAAFIAVVSFSVNLEIPKKHIIIDITYFIFLPVHPPQPKNTVFSRKNGVLMIKWKMWKCGELHF